MKKWLPFTIRWIARLTAIAVASLYGALVAGELISPHSAASPQPVEWAGIVALSLGVLGALAAALTSYSRRELVFALLSISSFGIWFAMFRPSRIEGWLMAAPAVLFLCDWSMRKWWMGERMA